MKQQKQTNKIEWKEIEIGDILDYEQPGKYIVEKEILKHKTKNSVPVLTANKSFILGYTEEKGGIYDKSPVIIFDDFTTDSKFVDFKFKVKSSAMKLLTPKSKEVNLRFVFLMMKSINVNFATHKRYYLSVYQKRNIPMPFSNGKPDLKEQERIIKILEEAEELTSKSKKAEELLDEYLKSVFYEMFYNKGFEEKTFRDISKLSQGLQIPISKRKNIPASDTLPYITIQFLNGHKDPEYIQNAKQNVICTIEDVLMTRTGNTGQVVTDVEGVFHNNFFKIDYDRSMINKIYLVFYLRQNQIKKRILSLAGQSTIPDLNHGDFYNLDIIVPPLPLQEKFALIVEQVEKMKENISKTKQNSEELFNSLISKAFGGEL